MHAGHTMYVQRMGQRLGLGVYAVHATFQFSGTPGKRHRMREFSLWHDPPEYYNHPNGFITFTVRLANPVNSRRRQLVMLLLPHACICYTCMHA